MSTAFRFQLIETQPVVQADGLDVSNGSDVSQEGRSLTQALDLTVRNVLVAVLLGSFSMAVLSSDWGDPLDPVVITTDAVASARLPALRVLHEDGPGGWQIYDDVEPLKNPAVLTKQKLLVLDPSIATLKDLPVGWEASRENSSDIWHRRKVKQ